MYSGKMRNRRLRIHAPFVLTKNGTRVLLYPKPLFIVSNSRTERGN
jgi:hypothetical protein